MCITSLIFLRVGYIMAVIRTVYSYGHIPHGECTGTDRTYIFDPFDGTVR